MRMHGPDEGRSQRETEELETGGYPSRDEDFDEQSRSADYFARVDPLARSPERDELASRIRRTPGLFSEAAHAWAREYESVREHALPGGRVPSSPRPDTFP